MLLNASPSLPVMLRKFYIHLPKGYFKQTAYLYLIINNQYSILRLSFNHLFF